MNPATPLLQFFRDQSVTIRSIVVQGFEPSSPFAEFAAEARALRGTAPGIDLLVAPEAAVRQALEASAATFAYRAVIAWRRDAVSDSAGVAAWKLQRDLFDRGLVCIATLAIAGGEARCFLASDAIRALPRAEGAARGHVTMATLGNNGRFANQLFQYAYTKLYALRHGLTAGLPDWQGRELYGLDDPSCADVILRRMSYAAFSDDDRRLWEQDDPPIDIDFDGYFQETPACWQHQRPLLRRLFQLAPQHTQAIDAWRARVTQGGARTLVAIHVRRDDYRNLQAVLAWFRLVPEQWYLDWLRALWPTLRRPLLFVATDEPETMLPVFREFESVAATFGPPAASLPDHVRDFEALRRADHLALCNSSYSRMAAILAPSTQSSWLPSFATQRFERYEPWIDPGFWTRFSGTDPDERPATRIERALARDPNAPSILFDVSDLLYYLVEHPALSGIQRVQCEMLRHLMELLPAGSVRAVVLKDGDAFATVDSAALSQVLATIASGAATRVEIVSDLRSLLRLASPCTVQPRDIFLTIGAFWPVRGMGRLLQRLKIAGVIIGTLIHDLLPIDAPEYFEPRSIRLFVKGVVETLTFSDFVFTTSQYNRASVARLFETQQLSRVPVQLLPLAREPAHAAPSAAAVSEDVQRVLDTEYVLCVGTIEVRKNPAYLFHLWKMLAQSGRASIPNLVFAGRKGWWVRDFLDQLAACDFLGGRIVLVNDATDVELDLLYRNCLLTMFPSFAEGWGLPVGESLAHGKVCLSSGTTGIPDAGGTAADYIDPYNVRDGYAQLTRYLDDPELRSAREREVVQRFTARSWRDVTEDFLESMLALAREVRSTDTATAIRLPPGHYLPVTNDGAALEMAAIDGALSAEVACASGWHPTEIAGARAIGSTATLQFRAAASTGAKIVLVLRLAAHGHACRIAMRSGSGAQAEANVVVGAEQLAVLNCEVEAGSLVSVQLSSTGTTPNAGRAGPLRQWSLKGILYFEPQRLTAAALMEMQRGRVPAGASGAPRPRIAVRPRRETILLSSTLAMDANHRVNSPEAFRQSTDRWLLSEASIKLGVPLFADDTDRRSFAALRATSPHAEIVGRADDSVRLIRRSDVFVSMARFSEGSIFDRTGVWRAMGYMQGASREFGKWMSSAPEGLRIDADALAAAPFHDAPHLVFYNGNLHNYFHWIVEGLLCLDVLTQTMATQSNLRIALPKSMDIAAVLDHRGSLPAVGLGERNVDEIGADLIRVREAIWVESDQVQTMPASYLQQFQRRVAARHAAQRSPTKRRLLVARRGPTRTITNLGEVEALLARHDFETVYLEGMSVLDQILLFQNAEFVVSPHGAGLSNLLFCDPGTRVIEFMPTVEFRPFFWVIAAKLGLIHGLQFCPTTDGQFQGALDVDVKKLGALVRVVGDASAPVVRPRQSA